MTTKQATQAAIEVVRDMGVHFAGLAVAKIIREAEIDHRELEEDHVRAFATILARAGRARLQEVDL